jgi:hypothetical protein
MADGVGTAPTSVLSETVFKTAKAILYPPTVRKNGAPGGICTHTSLSRNQGRYLIPVTGAKLAGGDGLEPPYGLEPSARR